MLVDLIQVPYDAGHRDERMGAGPGRLVASGAADRLRAAGATVRETVVGAEPGFTAEIASAFELARSTAFAVRVARGRGSLPLVLAGNCISAVGTVAAISGPGTGVIWLDAHADLNTPETTSSGMMDGMALATLLGRCWTGMAAQVDGFQPVAEENVMLVGVRDLDEPEREYLQRSRILAADTDVVRDAATLAERLDAFAARVDRIYLHLDLDVHDVGEGRANPFSAPGGLTAEEVRSLVRQVAARIPIAAASVTAYDPSGDADGRMLDVSLALVQTIAEAAARHGPDAAGIMS
jgi:arginase